VKAPEAGLCNACVHQRVVGTTRGSVFSLCEKSKEDPRFPKYPRIPVVECDGFTRASASVEETGP
jgi:hypothetical protein